MSQLTSKHTDTQSTHLEEENQPFLERKEDIEEYLPARNGRTYRKKSVIHTVPWYSIAFLTQTVVCICLIGILWTRSSSVHADSAEQNEPASRSYLGVLSSAVQYKIVTPPSDYWMDNTYTNLDAEADAAWMAITADAHPLRMSQEDLSYLNISESLWSGQELEGGGYAGMLAVLHNLHCLRVLSRTAFRSFDDASPKRDMAYLGHLKHCTEVMRRSMMCNADLAHLPMIWSVEAENLVIKPTVPQRCVDWDALMKGLEGKYYNWRDLLPQENKQL